MFAQQSNQIPPLNQRMDTPVKKSVFQRNDNTPFFNQNTGNQNMFSNQTSMFGNKHVNNYKLNSVFSNQRTDSNNNHNSMFPNQQTDNNQNRIFPNQRGRGRGRGNAFSNNSNRGRKSWGQNNQTAFNHFQQAQQSQEQPQHQAFQQQQQQQPVQNQSASLHHHQQQQHQLKQPRQKRQQQQQQVQRQKTQHQQSEQSNMKQVTAAERAKRFGSTDKSDLYNQLKKMRIQERQQAIENGLLPDPENPTTLNEAISFRGTCASKCPEFEIAERDYQNLLEPFEKDEEGNVDPEKCIKAYRRSAAGVEQPLPSDVRTPDALLSTLDYLIDEVLSNNTLEQCHAFVRDRTRSIRQDFTLQNLRDITAVTAHERIARFHILCVHEMCEVGQFSMQQELEQLNKVLLSLMEFYDDLREEGVESENEAEFRAYHLLSHIRDQDVARQAQTLPIHIFRHPYMKKALQLHALSQRNNEIMETSSRRNKPENVEASQNYYSKLFKLIADDETSFLMACMMECHFPDIRKGALKAMNTAYMVKAGGVQAEDIRRVLAYDNIKQLLEEVTLYGIFVDMSLGEPTICFGQKHYRTKVAVFREPLSNPVQTRSNILVEPKKSGRSFREIINGTEPKITIKSSIIHPITPSNASPFNSWMNMSTSPAMRNDEGLPQTEQKQKQLELETIRTKAAAAEAQLSKERKRVEAAMEKKRQEEAEKQALKLQEQQRILEEQEEQERKLLEIEEIKKEILKREEQQRISREQERIKREKEEQLKQKQQIELMRKENEAAEADRREQLHREKLQALLEKMQRQRVLRAKHCIKQKITPYIRRVRERIEKRDKAALERRRMWHFNLLVGTENPYSSVKISNLKCLHSTSEGIRKRVGKCLSAEQYALENLKQPLNDHQSEIWRTENFSLDIYPRIKDKIVQKNTQETACKLEWQLLIHVADEQLDSSNWFCKKFGLDDEFHSRKDRYQDLIITSRMITPGFDLPSKWVDETGAIIFSLPESKEDKSHQEIVDYWSENKRRLDKLTANIQKYNPEKQIPILFTYFPDNTDTRSTLEKIPTNMGLGSNSSISDYHLLFMNPLTITNRIIDEVNWLSAHSL